MLSLLWSKTVTITILLWGFPGGSTVKNPPANAGGQEDPLEEETIHFNILAWRSHGQRNLAGFSPWGCKESDTTEHMCQRARAHTHTHTHTIVTLRCLYMCVCMYVRPTPLVCACVCVCVCDGHCVCVCYEGHMSVLTHDLCMSVFVMGTHMCVHV